MWYCDDGSVGHIIKTQLKSEQISLPRAMLHQIPTDQYSNFPTLRLLCGAFDCKMLTNLHDNVQK